MPSPTDFNLTPYYDDYAESKKFHRILFRPAFAVQARELTQSQTILQNQIERVSDHFFEKGAMVIPGEISYDLDYRAIKLTSFTGSSTLSNFVGKTFKGATSGVLGVIVNSVVTDGVDPDTLFVKYLNSGSSNTAIAFTNSEIINESSTAGVLVSGGFSAVVDSTATGSAALIAEGVYYINGFHVQVNNQTVILDKYSNTPSYRVGLLVTESFVASTDDNTLLDNAQGSSNVNAPGADRFKINLTLEKRIITSSEDANFVELLRLRNGILQNQVRTTEYAVLEDTFARRTFDESGDYTVRDFDLDLREHIVDENNRGIFTLAQGGTEALMAAGLSPGKAYVQGYELSTIGTTFLDVEKARDFATQNNFNTRIDLQNFVHVTNIFNSPDIGFVSGDVEPLKTVNLYIFKTSARGTQNTGSGSSVYQIGRAKTRGFEYVTGPATANIFASASATSAIYKQYLFDIEMFTHLNILSNQAYSAGVKITGNTSGAVGYVHNSSTTEATAVSDITVASPGVVDATGHTFREGQQIKFSAISADNNSTSITTADIFTVRNPATDSFELFESDGTTPTNITSFSSAGNAIHGVVVVSSVNGTFVAGETITDGSNTAVIQANAVGFRAVRSHEFSAVKQIGMAGGTLITYTADTALDSTYGEVTELTGLVSIANSSDALIGSGTTFLTELKVGDEITFDTNAGTTISKNVEAIISNTSLTLTSAVGGADVTTSNVFYRKRGKINGSNKNISIFQLPYKKIKTLNTAANGGSSDTNYAYRKQFTATLSANGDATITAGTNETYASLLEKDFVVSVVQLGAGTTGALGDVLSLSGNNHEGDPIFVPGGSPTGKTLKFDFGANYQGHKIKILTTISKSIGDLKTKNLTENATVAISSQTIIESGTIGIGKADIYRINNVYMSPNFSTVATTSHTNITSRFNLDNGQRDNYYDIGRIVLKSGELTPTGRLLIDFDFFEHGTGEYFAIDSYTGSIDYEEVYNYISDTTGKEFDLRDCIDLRPRVDDASTIPGSTSGANYERSFDGSGASVINFIEFGSDMSNDFEYYLPRIDKIFLDKEGNFKVSKGNSALIPQTPLDVAGAMHLYTLEIPAYTLSTEDVTIKKIDNRRFTMRDIGKLQDRIENLEYYTQLSLLETQAQNLQIQDASGFDRFKNGFVVDNFTGHNIGDPGNVDYKCAIDMARGELRPLFSEDAVSLVETDDDGTAIVAADRTASGYQKTGDLITLPYTESVLIDQPFASKTLNINPFDIINFTGTIQLTPETDEWKETERAPELVINNVGGFDTLASNLGNSALAGFEIGTIWNEWQDSWTGTPVDITSRDTSGELRDGRRVFRETEIESITSVSQTRTGVRQTIVPQTIRNSIGDRIISVAFVPFIRSREVQFVATRMKPNTRVFPFFDNINITAYVTPLGGALGGSLVTDNNGSVSGTFSIPDPKVDANPRWRAGTRVFRLTSSSTDGRTDVETAAESDYVARGLLETVQNTIISTREPTVVRETTNESRSIARTSTRSSTRTVGWVDPLAQTFLIDDEGGVFLTSIDIFFSSKDDNIPVSLQIREVINGYPGNKILPFSEVIKNPNTINISADGTASTTFTFPSPVFIQENIEYCFVLLANTDKYLVYVSRLGETVIGSNRTISQQPYAGVLFKSQNGSTWTADQNEDLKFKIKRAEFSSTPGTVTLSNAPLSVRTLTSNPIRTTNGSNVVKVFHKNHGMHGLTNRVTIAGVPSSGINGIIQNEINATHTSISNVTLDSYDITLASNATDTGDIGGSAVTASQNRVFDVLNINVSTLTVPGTSIDTTLRTTSGRSVHGSETEFSRQSAAEAEAIVTNDNIYFTAPRMVASEINETNQATLGNGTRTPSILTNFTLRTSNTKHTPILDLQRASAFVIHNRLNNPNAGNTPNFVDETASTGGSASAVYLTRPITLANASTALDIRLTANVQSSSEIEVYFRTTSSSEPRDIENLSYIAFNGDGSEDITVTPASDSQTFQEYKYSVNAVDDFTAFQIKIVLKGTISSYPPIIKDFRGIALAV